MITPTTLGNKAFHLESLSYSGGNTAQLDVLYRDRDNGIVRETVEYAVPPGFGEVVKALAGQCPMHMVGFQEQDGQLYLADARTVWGYSCPCNG